MIVATEDAGYLRFDSLLELKSDLPLRFLPRLTKVISSHVFTQESCHTLFVLFESMVYLVINIEEGEIKTFTYSEINMKVDGGTCALEQIVYSNNEICLLLMQDDRYQFIRVLT